jgi:hypothetical protein
MSFAPGFQQRFPPLQCHYCKKIGHKQVDCFYFFKDSRKTSIQAPSSARMFVKPLQRNISHVPKVYHQHPQQQQQQCQGPCCVQQIQQQQQQPEQSPRRETTPMEEGKNEYLEALKYMLDTREEMGKDSFRTYKPFTALGEKVHAVFVQLEEDCQVFL